MSGIDQKFSDVLAAIGNTPLIRLKGASELTGCDIYGKAEFLNPGQSVKDRAALWIIRDAARRGALRPGGTIVEGTAGNTGIGLAMVGNALGYKTVIVLPRTQSQEKKDAIRSLGAKLVEVDAVPYSNPMHYARYSESWRKNSPRPSPTAPSGPTNSTMSQTGFRTTKAPARKSGTKPAARLTALSALSAPAAR
jgi:cysteine synthase